MTRPIKFRAWDGERMIEHGPLYLSTGGHLYEEKPCGTEGSWLDPKDPRRFKLMFFTGLLDKNGKEVYEGDVVISSWWSFGKENARKHVVKYNEEDTRFSIGEKPEVIGNIYENPELLPDKV